MHIKFLNLKIHNFLSFGDAEINFDKTGYTLISGVNNNPKDAALSNGSGKSSIWSAICWALTGETIQGLSNNVENIYLNSGCWVELSFNVDKDNYKLIRYRNDPKLKSDLKIYINGEDKSGKGIRESQNLLEQYLPDITSELIGSVIILGQGMPHKFSNNTPAKRKEILEKLSKSDFMIEDIKEKLTRRSSDLNKEINTLNENRIFYESQLNMLNKNLDYFTKEIEKIINNPIDCDLITNEINKLEEAAEKEKTNADSIREKLNGLHKQLIELSDFKNGRLLKAKEEYDSYISPLNTKKIQFELEMKDIQNKLNEFSNIKDVCPTCGQKLPKVWKPDAKIYSMYLEQLTSLDSSIVEINEQLQTEKNYYNDAINKFNNDYVKESSSLNEAINKYKDIVWENDSKYRQYQQDILDLKIKLNNYTNTKTNLEKYNQQKISCEEEIKELTNKILYINQDKEKLLKHGSVLDKMSTLIKRDFRGFLLKNVIDFINNKAKEYCKEVFGTQEINFNLNGNNIDITYCNKYYENLSGGEKQKVDLIIQFALRDMLCQYMNFSSSILVLDEVFDNLDAIGCSKVLNLISCKLVDIESIYIISHHGNELTIPYDNEIIVEKDEEGISRVK